MHGFLAAWPKHCQHVAFTVRLPCTWVFRQGLGRFSLGSDDGGEKANVLHGTGNVSRGNPELLWVRGHGERLPLLEVFRG